MRTFFCFLFLLCGVTSFCQKHCPEFGKIDLPDLQATSCPFEKEAAAMKLFDLEELEYIPNLYEAKMKTEKRVRIKIFNREGYKFASVKIPYYSKNKITRISDLKGVVYNLDESGKVVVSKLEKKDFFKDQAEESISFINFTFPNLKPGSVVEYSYTKTEKEGTVAPWLIQDDIPVAYAARTLILPSRSRLKEKIYGTDSLQYSVDATDNERTKKTYYKENVPSFHLEPFMGSLTDNLLRAKFLFYPYGSVVIDSLYSPEKIWTVTNLTLLEAKWFGGQMDVIIPGTILLADSARKQATTEKKIEIIYEAVKRRLVNGDIQQAFRAHDLVEAWQNKQANTAEINLILLNLLRKAGVAVYPLLVSTRTNGKINVDFPSSGQFNGVDVLALDSNRSYVLDASIKGQSYKIPPLNIMNRMALIVNKEAVQWVNIEDQRPLMRQETNIKAAFDNNACMEGAATIRQYDLAKVIALDSAAKEESEKEKMNEKVEGVTVNFQQIIGSEMDAAPLEQQIDFTYTPQKTGDFYFIKPLFLFTQKPNPFISSQRNTDIDLGCNQQISLSMVLRLPSQYQVEFLPKSTVVRAQDSSFYYRRTVSTDSLQVYYQHTFEIRRSVFHKEEYPNVREFFKRAYALMAEEMILKKKK